ncbi:hypothetical protein FLAG1_00645 [Fusarium langsethiae]|uniref:Uncharacterized protein n=1 Tax=Fusarium langsethiae TaxID=179993 RepID=A0A0N0DI65_FUSLA|nr:hypothetical protein FLAG1_00645 [Fusarium langsethiae]
MSRRGVEDYLPPKATGHVLGAVFSWSTLELWRFSLVIGLWGSLPMKTYRMCRNRLSYAVGLHHTKLYANIHFHSILQIVAVNLKLLSTQSLPKSH